MSAVGGVGTGMATIEFCETATRSVRFALAADLAMTRVVIAARLNCSKSGSGQSLVRASITLTLDTYAHVIPSLQEEVARKMDDLMSWYTLSIPYTIKHTANNRQT